MVKWFRCDDCGKVYSVSDVESDSNSSAVCPQCGTLELEAARKNAIKRIVQERGISYLLHFTRLQNLDGILEHGIYPNSRLGELPDGVAINDHGRWDYHPDSISLSICFPNHLMFFKYRNESQDEWVVLVISPSVLWESKCAFCKHNAADGRISCLPVNKIDDHNALLTVA